MCNGTLSIPMIDNNDWLTLILPIQQKNKKRNKDYKLILLNNMLIIIKAIIFNHNKKNK